MCLHNKPTQILIKHLFIYSCLDFCGVDSFRRYVSSYNSKLTVKNILNFHREMIPHYKLLRVACLYGAVTIYGLKKIKAVNVYVVNKRMHIDKMCFIVL